MQNLELVRRIQSLAEKKGVTAGQLALAWVMYRGDDVIPIPGTRRVKYLEENVAAARVTLSPEDLEALEAAVPRGAVGSLARRSRVPCRASVGPLPGDGEGMGAV